MSCTVFFSQAVLSGVSDSRVCFSYLAAFYLRIFWVISAFLSLVWKYTLDPPPEPAFVLLISVLSLQHLFPANRQPFFIFLSLCDLLTPAQMVMGAVSSTSKQWLGFVFTFLSLQTSDGVIVSYLN